MKIDRTITGGPLEVADAAARAEAAGFDGVLATETNHDPFVTLAAAAMRTTSVEMSTQIAVAFARTPMTMATAARDLQVASQGRFTLGIGSQVAAHVTRRFSMPWSDPAARMREFVLAMRAIWASWRDGTALQFRGDFYTHTLMTPMFVPEPTEHPDPPILIAAVGPRMTEVAGEVADGMLPHPFTTERYLREQILPALERGRMRRPGGTGPLELPMGVFVVTGRDQEEHEAAATAVKRQLAFYASTPAYRTVLDTHGWGDAHEELLALSKQGEWKKMGELFDDEMLGEFAIVAEPDAVAAAIDQRYGDVLTRLSLAMPYRHASPVLTELLPHLRAAAPRP